MLWCGFQAVGCLVGCLPGRRHTLRAKLDRLARSLPDAKDIVDELTVKGVNVGIGGSVHDPMDPFGWLWFNVVRPTVYRTVQRQTVPAPERPIQQVDFAAVLAR